MYLRKQLYELEKRINEKKNLIQVITGPRQSGKTTLAQQITNKLQLPYHFVSADTVPSNYSLWVTQQWDIARSKFKNSSSKIFLLIIDEIQKINNWSEYVKKEFDKDRLLKLNIKVILLGSSTLLISKGLTESLFGRFEMIKLSHWTFKEMNEAFGFSPEQYVYFGGYPGAVDLIEDESRWRDYIRNSIIETTISKDILQLTTIQKPALLKNLFELACIHNGEILSYNKLLGQLTDAGNTTTLSHYAELLDNIWMLTGLQKFSGSKINSKSSTPKWIVYNSALTSAYNELSFKETLKDLRLWGRKIEQAVGSFLINNSRIENFDLYYWRDGNNEVDFIIKTGKKTIAIEFKSGKATFHKGLVAFSEKFKPMKTILVSDYEWNWKDFFSLNISQLFDYS